MLKKWLGIPVVGLIIAGGVTLYSQTASIGIDQAYGGDRNVTGQGVPGSAPLTVYDVTSGTRSYLGRSNSVDQQGFYAVAVDPPLSNGQKIIVVDAQNRSSDVAAVIAKSGPAGPK